MERIPSSILTEEHLKTISAKVTGRLKEKLGKNKAIEVRRGMAIKKSTNELVMLLTCKQQKAKPANPLML